MYYSIEQQKYIDSVEGLAHQSAVEIIGKLVKQRDELLEACRAAKEFMSAGIPSSDEDDLISRLKAAIANCEK